MGYIYIIEFRIQLFSPLIINDMTYTRQNIIRPTVSEIKVLIETLHSLNVADVTIEEVKSLITSLITGYEISTPKIPTGEFLYRGIRWDARPSNVSQLTYPSPHRIKAFQRANRPGESLFYCSNLRSVPLFELDVKPGHCIALSKWRIDREMIVSNAGYTHKLFDKFLTDRSCPEWVKHDSSFIEPEQNVLVNQYLSEVFTEVISPGDEAKYKVTTAIAEKLIEGNIYTPSGAVLSFDGIIYPTISGEARADNFAIKPSFVDNYLTIVKAEYIYITDRPERFHYKVNVLNYADTFGMDGAIEWKG